MRFAAILVFKPPIVPVGGKNLLGCLIAYNAGRGGPYFFLKHFTAFLHVLEGYVFTRHDVTCFLG